MPLRPTRGRRQDLPSTQVDPRARFFDDYRKEAEEYDREFMKKYDEDLNTTLIFVSFMRSFSGPALTRSQAGLFSAVTSAFIIEVHSHLQQDPNDETAALLRVLIHKIDNTTFGNNPPTLPQWTGPPHTIVHVQAILFASLAASLLSAFLAVLGKQWLNRYISTDMRGTAIERSQNRQRKLDGVVTWYFDHVMESLPLMLQAALLLLGCALSRYLWEINITVASVIIAVTSLGMAFYVFIIVAGTASESCPYQTPGARIIRQIFRDILLPDFRSAPSVISKHSYVAFSRLVSSRLVQTSFTRCLLIEWWSSLKGPWYSLANTYTSILFVPRIIGAVAMDALFLGLPILWLLAALGRTVCRWVTGFLMAVYNLGVAFPTAVRDFRVDFSRIPYYSPTPIIRVVYRLPATLSKAVYHSLLHTFPPRTYGLDQQTAMLDLRCVSWMLQTSLDKAVHLSTLKHLVTMMTLADFDPVLVFGCFDVFIGCVNVDVNNRMVVIIQGLEELAVVSAMCLLRTLHHLSVVDPGSSVLRDTFQRYNRVFPLDTDFTCLPFYYTIAKIHSLANGRWNPRHIRWGESTPLPQECVSFTRGVAEVAQVGQRQTQNRKVPRWILRFALHSLSLDPLPPTSAIADCLLVIAIDLDCDVSNTGFITLGEQCVHV